MSRFPLILFRLLAMAFFIHIRLPTLPLSHSFIDTLTWSNPHTIGDIPYSRDGHSATIIGNSMYIFGGYEEEFERFSQDVFALNLDTMYWTYVETKVIS